MDKSKKTQTTHKKLENQIADICEKAEVYMVDSYKKLEGGAMAGLNKLEHRAEQTASAAEDFWVETLFLQPGETLEQAKQRLAELRAQSLKQSEKGLQNLSETVADLYQKIEDGVYDVYKTLETGALKATDALMDFCEDLLVLDDDSKPPKAK